MRLVVFLLGATLGSCDGTVFTLACDSDDDCPSFRACSAGACLLARGLKDGGGDVDGGGDAVDAGGAVDGGGDVDAGGAVDGGGDVDGGCVCDDGIACTLDDRCEDVAGGVAGAGGACLGHTSDEPAPSTCADCSDDCRTGCGATCCTLQPASTTCSACSCVGTCSGVDCNVRCESDARCTVNDHAVGDASVECVSSVCRAELDNGTSATLTCSDGSVCDAFIHNIANTVQCTASACNLVMRDFGSGDVTCSDGADCTIGADFAGLAVHCTGSSCALTCGPNAGCTLECDGAPVDCSSGTCSC